ncbi:MAG: hypothetical protein N2C12_18215 [Planctomycetales bacterium]
MPDELVGSPGHCRFCGSRCQFLSLEAASQVAAETVTPAAPAAPAAPAVEVPSAADTQASEGEIRLAAEPTDSQDGAVQTETQPVPSQPTEQVAPPAETSEPIALADPDELELEPLDDLDGP